MDDRSVPRTALLSATFFAESLISVPVGPSSVHLLFAGLMGIMLGLGIFPAVLVALALRAILFGFGGLTTLGITAVNIGLPGAIPGLILGPPCAGPVAPRMAVLLSGLVGVLSVWATGGLPSLSLWLSASAYVPVTKMLFAAYLPLTGAEAAIVAVMRGFFSGCSRQHCGLPGADGRIGC